MPPFASAAAVRALSLGVGINVNNRSCEPLSASPAIISFRFFRIIRFILRNAGHDSEKLFERLAHRNAIFANNQFTDGAFVLARAFLQNAEGLANFRFGLEISEQ